MATPKTRLTDPDAIIREFEKRQKRVVVMAMISFALMVPLVIAVRKVNPIYAAVTLVAFLLPAVIYYFMTFRCPACGTRVQQRRKMLRMPIRCGSCGAVLDPR